MKSDERILRRVRGYNLFACEAKYHRRCLQNYCSILYYRSDNQENKDTQTLLEADHKYAYDCVYDYIKDYILKGKVCNLSHLRNMYIEKLSETDSVNPNYKSENLKEKMLKDTRINQRISMVKVKPKNREFVIVYSNHISVADAIAKGFMLAQQDLIKDSAEFLADQIKTAFKEEEDMPWPPTADDLTYDQVHVPPDLYRFLLILIGGSETKYSIRTERLATSIAQDLMKAATNGDWVQPKHVLLSTTLRHLFRSKEVSLFTCLT